VGSAEKRDPLPQSKAPLLAHRVRAWCNVSARRIDADALIENPAANKFA